MKLTLIQLIHSRAIHLLGSGICHILLVGTLLLSLGCGQQNQTELSGTTGTATEDASPADPENAPAQADQSDRQESPWVGRWKFVLTEGMADFVPFMVQIEEKNGQRLLQVSDKAPQQQFQKWSISQAGFTNTQIMLTIPTGQLDLQFQGTMQEDVIVGSVITKERPIPTPARFEKTSDTNLRGLNNPEQTPGAEEFAKIPDDAPEKIKALREFIDEHQKAPLAIESYKLLLAEMVQQQTESAELAKFLEEFCQFVQPWGISMLSDTYLQIVVDLEKNPGYRDLTGQYLEKLKNFLGDNPPEVLKSTYDLYYSKHLLASPAEAEQKQGFEALNTLLAESPFEHNALIELAGYHERTGQIEQARDIYTKLAVIPGFSRMISRFVDPVSQKTTTPSEKSRTLFEGDDAAYAEYSKQVYEKESHYFVEKPDQPSTLADNRRIPLLELFTGAMCPPCVAGDLAVAGIEKTYPSPEALVVRYHQHIPGPDPLTNPDGESRFGFYGGTGTPALFINGRKTENVGGFFIHAEQIYDELKPHVGSLINQISAVRIDLKTALNDQSIQIQCQVTGVSDTRRDVKLRFLLVEPELYYLAPNGVRIHEMIVRSMPGGPQGIDIKSTTTEAELSIDVSKLKNDLNQYLKAYQENRNYQFDTIPLDLNELQIIALVQDDETREILQSAVVPVIKLPTDAEKQNSSEAAETKQLIPAAEKVTTPPAATAAEAAAATEKETPPAEPTPPPTE